jgi:hypothetical protein
MQSVKIFDLALNLEAFFSQGGLRSSSGTDAASCPKGGDVGLSEHFLGCGDCLRD